MLATLGASGCGIYHNYSDADLSASLIQLGQRPQHPTFSELLRHDFWLLHAFQCFQDPEGDLMVFSGGRGLRLQQWCLLLTALNRISYKDHSEENLDISVY